MSMDIDSYIEQKKFLYGNILKFIEDCEANNEDDFQILIEIIKPHELSQVLKIIISISNNHYRDETYSNLEIYQIFGHNPTILLFLIKNEIIIFDETINTAILNESDQNGIQYCHFFLPEIKTFTDEETFKNIKSQLTEDELAEYDKKRLLGENDTYICELIRNDSVDEFISYLNRRNLSHSSNIRRSIFETNAFLKEHQPTLIEYAAFFGSVQIFNYLLFSHAELTSNLWLYAIHSKNAELIHLLEINQIEPPNGSYELCLIESIKCHHNYIAKYFEEIETIETTEAIIESCFQSYNYEYISVEMKENYIFFYLCQYEYSNLIDIWLEEKKEEIEDFMNKNSSFFKKIFKTTNDSNLKFKAAEENRLDVIYYLLLNSSCIKKNEFKKCKNLKKVAIPSSIKSIEKSAFDQCSLLEKILIPPSVTSIGDYAFNQCLLLTEISIPHSVTKINFGAFCICSTLKQVSIPSSVTYIDSMAFFYCSSLTKITFEIPSSVTDIDSMAFFSCLSLEQIKIPSSVTSIGRFTFHRCHKLKQITIPSSVKTIGNHAFGFCSLLNQVSFEIPSSITQINQNVFSKCFNLHQIIIPSSVISIDDYAFDQCSSLTQISFEIPSSVTKIGISAFSECTSLTQIIIPSSVTSIGSCAFAECSSLTQIIIPSSITAIKLKTFYKCSSLTQITIPSSVTYIGHSAFSGCSSLTQIIIPSSVTYIGSCAFEECTSLAKITICKNAFDGCNLLQNLEKNNDDCIIS